MSNLTHITIGRCYLQFDRFEIFIKKISLQLQVLRITASNDTAYLDGNRWERLLVQHMSHLRKFNFDYRQSVEDTLELITDHAHVHRFTSSFWTERQWVIELIISIFDSSSIKITYSIHPYR
jgi:hypothetical protein